MLEGRCRGSWRAAGGQLKGSGTTGLREGPKRRKPDSRLITEAAQTVAEEMVRLSGERPSFVYKKPAVIGLTIKTLEEIFFGQQ